jgi:hypothetical protein
LFEFISRNKAVEKWELKEEGKNEAIYVVESENISSMTILISDCGRYIVTIDDESEKTPSDDSTVLSFFSNGNLAKGYRLTELLESLDNVSYSASHFSWMDGAEIKFVEPLLTLITYERTLYQFRLSDGVMQKKEKHPLRAQGAVFVSGEVRRINESLCEIEVHHLVWGEIPGEHKIVFEVGSPSIVSMGDFQYEYKYGGDVTCILHERKLVESPFIFFNVCNVLVGAKESVVAPSVNSYVTNSPENKERDE